MRNLFKTTTTVALIAGAALSLAACGKSETANNTVDNTSMTDMNAMTPMEGSTNDMSTMDMNSTGNDMMMDNSSMNSSGNMM